ncbi:MAG: hypothetical protein A2Y07_04585 [Planctomycetes bacterium GWF2_50_10]|nr:MAG: hypothetical protein A2Y07_04585 [Planctomycetes bacterium GWF2_50_10]
MTCTLNAQQVGSSRDVSKSQQRILSIDALRGFDMFWLIGGAELMLSFDQVFHNQFTRWLALQFQHTTWAGPRFYDFIFPLFLFIVGLVIPISIDRLKAKGLSQTAIIMHILKRTAVLVVLGMMTKGLLQGNVKFVSVLSRIGFGYFVAAMLILYTGPKLQAIVCGAILAVSWPAMMLIPIPALDGHVYLMEGVAKIVPTLSQAAIWIMSIPSVLAGTLAGYWLMEPRDEMAKLRRLAAAGAICVGAGLAWGLVYPRVFSLWTGSFVVFMAGCGIVLLSVFYYIIDVKKYQKWCKFFVVMGSNAVFIYFLSVSGIVDWSRTTEFFAGGVISHAGAFGPIIEALTYTAIMWFICGFLYRHRIFIKA